MASLFDSVATALEETTELDRLEARGTVRIALKNSGLEANSVTPDQLAVVLKKVMPGELQSRGIADATATCETLANRIHSFDGANAKQVDSPESVFQRLGG